MISELLGILVIGWPLYLPPAALIYIKSLFSLKKKYVGFNYPFQNIITFCLTTICKYFWYIVVCVFWYFEHNIMPPNPDQISLKLTRSPALTKLSSKQQLKQLFIILLFDKLYLFQNRHFNHYYW